MPIFIGYDDPRIIADKAAKIAAYRQQLQNIELQRQREKDELARQELLRRGERDFMEAANKAMMREEAARRLAQGDKRLDLAQERLEQEERRIEQGDRKTDIIERQRTLDRESREKLYREGLEAAKERQKIGIDAREKAREDQQRFIAEQEELDRELSRLRIESHENRADEAERRKAEREAQRIEDQRAGKEYEARLNSLRADEERLRLELSQLNANRKSLQERFAATYDMDEREALQGQINLISDDIKKKVGELGGVLEAIKGIHESRVEELTPDVPRSDAGVDADDRDLALLEAAHRIVASMPIPGEGSDAEKVKMVMEMLKLAANKRDRIIGSVANA